MEKKEKKVRKPKKKSWRYGSNPGPCQQPLLKRPREYVTNQTERQVRQTNLAYIKKKKTLRANAILTRGIVVFIIDHDDQCIIYSFKFNVKEE